MPHLLDVDQVIADLYEEDPESYGASLRQVRQILKDAPELKFIMDLCKVVEHSLESKSDIRKAGPILFFICESTVQRPDLIPIDVFERWLLTEDKFEILDFFSIATMVSRVKPKSIVRQYIVRTLHTTEFFLNEIHNNEDDSWQNRVRNLANELWINVGIADPIDLIAVAGAWFERFGWDTRLGNCFAQAFVEVASIKLDQISSMIDLLKEVEVREQLEDSSQLGNTRFRMNQSTPAKVIAKLENIRTAQQKREAIDWVIEELVVKFKSYNFKSPEKSKTTTSHIQENSNGSRLPDLYLDQLITDLCGDDYQRQDEAWTQTLKILRKTPKRIVKDLCEVVDYFLESEEQFSKAMAILFILSWESEQWPDHVPLDYLVRWIESSERLDDLGFLSVAIMVSRVQPKLIVERCLARALKVSERKGRSSRDLWSNIGISFPEILLEIAQKWFEHVGYDTEFGSTLANVFIDVAHFRQDKISSIIDILTEVEARKEPEEPLKPGKILIRLPHSPSPTDIISKLNEIQTKLKHGYSTDP